MAGASSMDVDGVRVAFMAATVASDSTLVVSSQVLTNNRLAFNAASTVSCGSNLVMPFSFFIRCASTASISARLKWEDEAEQSEDWASLPDTADTWTPIADNSDTWQIAA
jgi:hypothetical protein